MSQGLIAQLLVKVSKLSRGPIYLLINWNGCFNYFHVFPFFVVDLVRCSIACNVDRYSPSSTHKIRVSHAEGCFLYTMNVVCRSREQRSFTFSHCTRLLNPGPGGKQKLTVCPLLIAQPLWYCTFESWFLLVFPQLVIIFFSRHVCQLTLHSVYPPDYSINSCCVNLDIMKCIWKWLPV